MNADQYKRAKISAAKYCSFAERSPKQVGEKLQKWGLAEPKISQVIEELKTEGFINEERFAMAFSNDKFKFNKWGKIRISMELRQHKIDANSIEKGLGYISTKEYRETVKELLIKKWNQLNPEEEFLPRKKKTIDYVVRKGFESSIIFEIFEKELSSR